jgi:hypothetical protein
MLSSRKRFRSWSRMARRLAAVNRESTGARHWRCQVRGTQGVARVPPKPRPRPRVQRPARPRCRSRRKRHRRRRQPREPAAEGPANARVLRATRPTPAGVESGRDPPVRPMPAALRVRPQDAESRRAARDPRGPAVVHAAVLCWRLGLAATLKIVGAATNRRHPRTRCP